MTIAADAENAVETALIVALTAVPGVAGGVSNTIRAQGSAWPAMVLSMVRGVDDEAYAGGGLQVFDYDVKVIAPMAQQAGVAAILAAVHSALHRRDLAVVGFAAARCMRVRRIPRYAETTDTGTFIHRGSTYRIWVGAAA